VPAAPTVTGNGVAAATVRTEMAAPPPPPPTAQSPSQGIGYDLEPPPPPPTTVTLILVVVGGVVKVPGEVNTCILLKPPAGIADGAICGAVMTPVIAVFDTEPICGAVINPVICVFATNPEIFADAPKPPKFLLIPIFYIPIILVLVQEALVLL
jgi:hypothetical protein